MNLIMNYILFLLEWPPNSLNRKTTLTYLYMSYDFICPILIICSKEVNALINHNSNNY